jgi:hypothetical protein
MMAAIAAWAVAACGGGGHRGPAPTAPTASAGGDATASPRRPATPPLCGSLRVRVIGHVAATGLTEASGLVLSRGLLWTHDDSGGPATLFGISTRGRLVKTVAVPGAANVDWEDIAARGSTLYVADIGDNAVQRTGVVVYKLAGATTAIALRYPDGAHDAETLLLDGDTLVIATKSLSGESRVYTARKAGTLHHALTLQLGFGETVTGGDANATTIVLRTYDRAYVWARRKGESIVHALRRDPCTAGAALLSEGQGESLALTADGRAFYTLPEGASPILREYVSHH